MKGVVTQLLLKLLRAWKWLWANAFIERGKKRNQLKKCRFGVEIVHQTTHFRAALTTIPTQIQTHLIM